MELRAFVVALVSILNFASETLDKLVSEDGEGKSGKSSGKSSRPSRSSRSSKEKDDDKDDDDKDDDKDGDEPSEDDVVDAVRAAQKVLESADIKKLLKKHGKADRASEVEPELRQKVIDELEKAVEAAE